MINRLKNWLKREAIEAKISPKSFDRYVSIEEKEGKNNSKAFVIYIGKHKGLISLFYSSWGIWGTFEDTLVLVKLRRK